MRKAVQYEPEGPRYRVKSYVAYVTACRGNLLLGGVKHHESARFATSKQADDWNHAVVKGNCEAGRQVAAWGWNVVDRPPEITT